MIIYRDIQKKIEEWLFKRQIILLSGARQVGKTTLMKELQKVLIKKGSQTYFFNMEKISLKSLLDQNPDNLLLEISYNKKDVFFVFLDEVQLLDNPSHFLKYMYDEYENIKFIISGSVNFELKGQIKDSLVGRKITFQISPFSFAEFLSLKGYDTQTSREKKENTENYLHEYMLYGGLPSVVLEKNIEHKKILLEEYINTYLQRDVRSLVQEKSIAKFNQLTIILSSMIGSLKNNNAISQDLQMNNETLLRYLDIISGTYVFDCLEPYFTNVKKQIVKMKKVYCFDLGVRNAILNNFLPIKNRVDAGALFENFVFLRLQEKYNRKNLFFYRTKSGAEIDFIIQKDGVNFYEVKYKNIQKHNLGKGFISALRELQPVNSYVVNISQAQNIQYEGFDVRFIRYFDL
ncbi:hypothetical protein COB57_03265 [Candidatus Peregrinibacteria bacterium]|nr:MAG: hypothetical protein COB57_03265 [Candidatus Peregrinibacteria bacterium]